MKIRALLFFLLAAATLPLFAQPVEEKIRAAETQLAAIRQQEQDLLRSLEDLKLERLRGDLHTIGLPALAPGEEVIHHAAFSLVYSEAHEQASWVAHIITPDIIGGNISRSNDFRPDPAVTTGTAVQEDYFLSKRGPGGNIQYDGFGYDRGHLAPSADFRWSEKALSESYFYSNMSPQVAGLNRGKWAEMEDLLRDYITRHPGTQLFVVTGPVLREDLPKVPRSINGLSVPKLFFKVALDLQNQRAIGFLLPNQAIDYPLSSFVVPVDKVEEETGIDFFPALADDLENRLEEQKDLTPWLPPNEQGDVDPLYPPSLPPGYFNTVQARQYVGRSEEVRICGTVVSTHKSNKGNIFLNLDKKFPDQLFSVTIWKDNLVNFSFSPQELLGRQICVRGKVQNFNGVASMNVEREEQITFYPVE